MNLNRFALWRYSRVITVVDIGLIVLNAVSAFTLRDPAYLSVALWIALTMSLTSTLQRTYEQRDAAFAAARQERERYAHAVSVLEVITAQEPK